MMDTRIRPLVTHDRAAINRIIRGLPEFSPEEADTALELIDEWLQDGEESGYFTYVLEETNGTASGIRGYACFGPTPLTERTWDLYWVAVDAAEQGKGYGRRLMSFVEAEIGQRGGRLLLIETASQETYADTVRFYERAGYHLVCRIRNFYRSGDDKLTFAKELA